MPGTMSPTAGRRSSIPRSALCILHFCAALLVPSCAWDGHFDLLGYSTRPNYDTRYKTIRVPMCKSHIYMTVTPVTGLEMDLHRALVREIQLKTPYRIAQDDADTELVCTIVGFQKTLLNYTQFNTVREAETVLTVELYWRDLRTGEILTKKARRFGEGRDPDPRQPLLATPDSLLPLGTKPVAGGVPTSGPVTINDEVIDPVTNRKAIPVVLKSTAHFRPELGESTTTGLQKNIDRMAVQIVSAMEAGW